MQKTSTNSADPHQVAQLALELVDGIGDVKLGLRSMLLLAHVAADVPESTAPVPHDLLGDGLLFTANQVADLVDALAERADALHALVVQNKTSAPASAG